MALNFLVIGDAHIPDRAQTIPESLEKIAIEIASALPKGHFDEIFYTGDFTDSNHLFDLLLKLNGGDVRALNVVIGNMDHFTRPRGKIRKIDRKDEIIKDYSFSLPNTQIKLRIGLMHGHRIRPRGDHAQLLHYARSHGINILLTGHTHAEELTLLSDEVLIVNPGSCTGAWSFLSTMHPSFVHLSLHDSQEGEFAGSREIGVIVECNLYREGDKVGHPSERLLLLFRNGNFEKI